MAMKNYKDEDSGGNQKKLLIVLGALVVIGLFLQFVWPGNIWW